MTYYDPKALKQSEVDEAVKSFQHRQREENEIKNENKAFKNDNHLIDPDQEPAEPKSRKKL